ncbi:MAG: SDR family NAD(P)-dependent oxidoreductase [Myxococcota bacterium]
MARVLIIGATSAIAAELCRRYAERGDALYLIGRNEAKLDALVASIPASVVGTQVADLDETDRNAERVATALSVLGGADLAVLAHGLLGSQVRTETDLEHAEQTIRTNFSSMVSLLIPLANAFAESGRGGIAVLSSVAGERGRPRNYTYGAAKGALTIYLQGLRSRLYRDGVAVHTIKLGPVDTPMTVDHPKNLLFANVDDVAGSIVAALDGPGGEHYVPWYWAPIMGVVRRLPEAVFQRLGFLSGR